MQDIKDGSYSQVTASALDNKWREDFERLKKARVHRCAVGLPAQIHLRDHCFCSGDVPTTADAAGASVASPSSHAMRRDSCLQLEVDSPAGCLLGVVLLL